MGNIVAHTEKNKASIRIVSRVGDQRPDFDLT